MFDSAFVANTILKDSSYSKQGLNVDQFKHFHKHIQVSIIECSSALSECSLYSFRQRRKSTANYSSGFKRT